MDAVCTRAASAVAPLAAPKVSSAGRSGAGASSSICLRRTQLKSQFLGSGRVHVSMAADHSNAANTKRGDTSVRALFFEKLAKLFGSDPTEEEQTFAVYEVNKLNLGSPFIVPAQVTAKFPIGNVVVYTNKVCKPSDNDIIGESAGLCAGIGQTPETPPGARYETTYTHYLNDYGQISAMGPYYTRQDSTMVVTGGTGIFVGAKGIVKIHNVQSPILLRYTYSIKGVQKLPESLTADLTFIPDKPPVTLPIAAPAASAAAPAAAAPSS